MTRNGKIARLPAELREELNRRLENGELGVRLIEWLNGLPEVKAVLEQNFGGVAISDKNLSEWKNGGFLDWQARQRAESMVERWSPQSGDGGSGVEGRGDGAASREVTEVLTERLVLHYAAALEDAIAETDEKASKRVARLGQSLRDVVRLRRFELTNDVEWERVKLERERLELQRAKSKQSGGQWESDEQERLSHLEKAEMVKQMLEEA